MKEFSIPQSQSEMNIQVQKSEPFVLIMNGNMSTGYCWYLKSENIDKKLKPLNLDSHNSSSEYKINTHPEGYVGVPGKWFFRFEPLEQGDIDLDFTYERAWEKGHGYSTKVHVNII
jgi:predicted secreted protein